MILYFLATDNIVTNLENALTNIKKQTFKIKQTDSKGRISFGTALWDKENPTLRFVMEVGDQKTTIVNDQKKIIMNVDRPGQKDRIKPKDITENPLSVIFKPKVQFVEHKDSQIQTKAKDLGHGVFQVVLHKFTDPQCQKDHLILEYKKTDNSVILTKWITVMNKKRVTIEFLP